MVQSRAVLLVGASGTLGTLATAALLRSGDCRVVALVRDHHPADVVETLVQREFESSGSQPVKGWRRRLCQATLPAQDLSRLDSLVAEHGVNEIVNCAGCLSYFDAEASHKVNVVLVEQLVEAAKRWSVERFIHVSSAFCSGFRDGPIQEQLHSEPVSDPTVYTTTKRLGEAVVADSGLPFLILRPSVVIGHSRTGHYGGPRYGLYQLWSGVERFLLDEYQQEAHYVAPETPMPLLHSDAFQVGLLAAMDQLPAGSIFHMTSRSAPTVRDVADLFFAHKLRPRQLTYHRSLGDVPLGDLSSTQRAFLRLAATNIEIASRPWDFETDTLDRLFPETSEFTDATIESVERCQNAYFANSNRLADYSRRFADRFDADS